MTYSNQKDLNNFVVFVCPSNVRTVNDLAEAMSCEVAQIVKSLIFCTKETKRPILVLASGINRVNEKSIETYIGEQIVEADANFAQEVTGFDIGGIPPFDLKQNIQTLIDEDLLKFEELWATAGTPNSAVSLQSTDLESLTGGKVISVK